MYEDVIELTGRKSGPTSMLLVGVHGNERCGIEAVQSMLPSLEVQTGTVFIAYGNPKAIELNVRCTDSNMNRLFRSDHNLSVKERASYEYTRVQFLKKYLDQSTALLDIHASTIPHSKPFAICERSAREIVSALPVGIVVSGFDTVEPGGTDYYMNKQGKVGICLESGYSNDSQSIRIATECILAFLNTRSHTQGTSHPRKQSFVHMYKKYVSKTDSFVLVKACDNFEVLEAGQLIGLDGEEEIRTEKQSLILFAHNGTQCGDEVFLLGEQKESLV